MLRNERMIRHVSVFSSFSRLSSHRVYTLSNDITCEYIDGAILRATHVTRRKAKTTTCDCEKKKNSIDQVRSARAPLSIALVENGIDVLAVEDMRERERACQH